MTTARDEPHRVSKLPAELLQCPSCTAVAIVRQESSLRCSACDFSAEGLGTLPMLVPAPTRVRAEFRTQLAVIEQEAERTRDLFAKEARKPGLLPSTRARLQQQQEIALTIAKEARAVLQPFLEADGPVAPELAPFHPLAGLHFLHRDWGWPESEENAKALELVLRVIDPSSFRKLLVLGSGGSRLAYDLHQHLIPEVTLALDNDPIVLLVAERILQGAPVTLTEARANATALARLAQTRELQLSGSVPHNFFLALADALAPPVAPGAFDTVLTPWFIDLVPNDLREFLGVLNRLLPNGGQWLNFGPLLYPDDRPPSNRYSKEELVELAELAGFSVEAQTEAVVPFSLSPLTDRGRLEGCIAFRARKVRHVRSASVPPPWLVLPYLPVPKPTSTPDASLNPGVRAVLALVDGQRSIEAIAAELSRATSAPRAVLLDSVRHCLEIGHDDCRA